MTRLSLLATAVVAFSSLPTTPAVAQDTTSQGVLILTNGDKLSGTFVRAVGNKVTFNNPTTGDLTVEWSAIRNLRTVRPVTVVRKGAILSRRTPSSDILSGLLQLEGQRLMIQRVGSTPTYIEIADVQYVVDQETLDKQLRGRPGFFQAWSGGITAGTSFIRAAQNSYNIDGSLNLMRTMPTGSWLAPRNRTTFALSGASGRITQPAYTMSDGTAIDEQVTKTNIAHLSLQRDQYFADRFFYFGVTQFDHNYSQNLQLQQLYGAGLGWTAIRTAAQTLDLTANLQYVRQAFIEAQPGDNKNLIGSTISLNYVTAFGNDMLFTQYVAYLPAFNQGDAYSIIERNTLSLPAYRGFRFAIGTVNSYLNSVALSEPPSKRNSFQFTFGLSYDIRSSY